MKKNLFLLTLCLMMGTAASAYDFCSVCPTGQTLAYAIASTNPPEVMIETCLGPYSGGVTIPETVSIDFTDYTVVGIGERAFWEGCSSMSYSGPLVIPNTVRYIGARAFWDCWFTGPLVIPNSVDYIGEWAFYGCRKFTSLTLSESLTYIEEHTFDECDNMRGDLIIPESVLDIASCGFSHCAFDGTLRLSPNMIYVYGDPFFELFNITAIEIPEGVGYIDWMAFDFLTKPTELELPSTMISIEDMAFRNLYQLKQMTVNAMVPPFICDETFQRVNHGIPVYIPVGTKEAYENAPNWSEFTNFIELEGVGLAEQESVAKAMAYPNPGFGTFNIQTDLPNAQVEVYDMAGRLIHRQAATEGTATIDATLWPSGVYAWRVVSDNKERTMGKWVKK
jgi:hypothetical protein